MKSHTPCFSRVFIFCILVLSGCQQATQPSSTSGPVTGTIDSQGFSTVLAVATASTTTPNAYDISLTGSASTPYVSFTVGDSPKTYTVTTFGTNGLAVTAYVGSFNFVSFDSGTLTISSVDVSAKQISGTLSSVKTSDGKSSLNGAFTATIQ